MAAEIITGAAIGIVTDLWVAVLMAIEYYEQEQT